MDARGLRGPPGRPPRARRGARGHARLLERELADVAVHDPRVATPTPPFEEAVASADAIVVAANHDEFTGTDVLRAIATLAGDDALVVDPWNCFGAKQVFAYVAELSAMTNGRVALP